MGLSHILQCWAVRLLLAGVVGVLCGAASALFLWLLDLATATRGAQPWLVYTLPLAGLALGALYERYGKSIQAGNNLVIDAVVEGGAVVPRRMTPMVLVGTVFTHLFGGSAGREGTAVQMGASLADWLSQRAGVGADLRRHLLIAGVAGGFGSVFGTPWAGAVFGLEMAVIGRWQLTALVPALVASFVGDVTTRALGIGHTLYPQAPQVDLSIALTLKWLVFAVAVALVTLVFIELTHAIKRYAARYLPRLPLRMFVGGVVVLLMWQASGTDDYLGLGVPTIVRAFSDPDLATYAFAFKLVFTAVTIGTGFLGGEVTPLFFVGATLGNVLARGLGIPLSLGAGVGLAAVFAAASNTPLALSIMAVELLGLHALPHVLLVCVVAFLLTGHRSIYVAQRFARTKTGVRLPVAVALRDWAQSRQSAPMPSKGPE